MTPDATFPSDNDWGIPTLDVGQQSLYIEGMVKSWGSLARKNRHKGTWHFYVDDYKFDNVWNDPEQLTNTAAVATVEVNYSANEQTPLAMFLWGVYRKRWLAKYWQSRGVRTFVDLNVQPCFDTWNLLGVPRGWKSYATRASDAEIDMLLHHAEVAKSHAGGDISLLVIGGGSKVRRLCKENLWLRVGEANGS